MYLFMKNNIKKIKLRPTPNTNKGITFLNFLWKSKAIICIANKDENNAPAIFSPSLKLLYERTPAKRPRTLNMTYKR